MKINLNIVEKSNGKRRKENEKKGPQHEISVIMKQKHLKRSHAIKRT